MFSIRTAMTQQTLCLIALLLLGCLLAASTTAAEPPQTTSETSALRLEPHAFEIGDGETVDTEMGYLTVPENRSDPESRAIELALVRFPSTSETPGSPIVYLAGGPGGSGIGAARGPRLELFMALRQFGDVIAFDQRGTGRSGGDTLRCRETYQLPLDGPGDPATSTAAMAKAVRACAERLQSEGIDISAYTSVHSAADLNDLRQALGAEKLTLWGISYGTHLALTTLKEHGEHIDRVILAGLEGLDQTYKLPSDQQELLEEISRMAGADPHVQKALPDLMASLRNLLTRLEKEPAQVQLLHPMAGMPVTVTLGAFDIQVAVANLLRGPSLFRFLPDLVARMEDGDFLTLATMTLMESMGRPPSMMSLAMDCASGASPERLARISKESKASVLGDRINFPLPGLCDAVPVRPLPAAFRQDVRSDVPALLISGTLDGRTPPHNGEDLLPGLSRASHLVLEGAGHSDPLFLSSPDILRTMERFLAGEEIQSRRLAVDVPSMVAPRPLAKLTAEQLQRFAGNYRSADGTSWQIQVAGDLVILLGGRRPELLRPMSDTQLFVELRHRTLELRLGEEGEVVGLRSVDVDGGPEGGGSEMLFDKL